MQRKRGELVPIGEALADLPGPVQALIPSPPTQRHFTRADQVNQLVSASEAAPDRGFMARMMALCCLPRSNPGNRHQYKRVNGPYKLIMSTTGEYKLPFGHLPRLLMAWISTEAVRTQNRVLILGDSLSDFMRELGIYSSDGKAYTRLRNQMNRLFNAHVRLIYKDEHGEASVSSSVADRTRVLVERASRLQNGIAGEIRLAIALCKDSHEPPGRTAHGPEMTSSSATANSSQRPPLPEVHLKVLRKVPGHLQSSIGYLGTW